MYAPIALIALVAVSGVVSSPAMTTPTPTPVLTPLKVGQQVCFPDSGVSNPFVNPEHQFNQSIAACMETKRYTFAPDPLPMIHPGSPSIMFDLNGPKQGTEISDEPGFAIKMESTDDDHFYYYNIHWIHGCQTTVPEQSVLAPISQDDPDSYCWNLLNRDYKDCNNGGRGGYIDVGCVRYSFQTYNMTDSGESGGKF